jgi:glyoxylase-like metal-dependent hydrolase (beta-lactamase superfamily II)
MIIQQKLSKMAIFSYLIIDPDTNVCAIVDPAFDTNRLLDEICSRNLHLKYVINTHSHADHIAGNASIIEKSHAELMIHREDVRTLNTFMNKLIVRVLGGRKSPMPEHLLLDASIIQVGNIKMKVLHTPGHTPGSICLYTSGNVITGDTLFVGAIGRTDLRGGSYQQLIASIHEKLYSLPPDTVVWPGHDYGVTPSSTIQHERETNPMT